MYWSTATDDQRKWKTQQTRSPDKRTDEEHGVFTSELQALVSVHLPVVLQQKKNQTNKQLFHYAMTTWEKESVTECCEIKALKAL